MRDEVPDDFLCTVAVVNVDVYDRHLEVRIHFAVFIPRICSSNCMKEAEVISINL
jgi:hypothetical protein